MPFAPSDSSPGTAPTAGAHDPELAAAGRGMRLALRASLHPERAASVGERGDRSFGALDARANPLLRALRGRGVRVADVPRSEAGKVYRRRIRDEYAKA